MRLHNSAPRPVSQVSQRRPKMQYWIKYLIWSGELCGGAGPEMGLSLSAKQMPGFSIALTVLGNFNKKLPLPSAVGAVTVRFLSQD